FRTGKNQDISMFGMTFFLCILKAFFDCFDYGTWQVLFKIIKLVIITTANAHFRDRAITQLDWEDAAFYFKNWCTITVTAKTIYIQRCRRNVEYTMEST